MKSRFQGRLAKREPVSVQEELSVKFRKMLGLPGPTRFGDPFGLLPLCQSLGLGDKSKAILKLCRPSVAIDAAGKRPDLSHTSSYLGGHPALPEQFTWPVDESGSPLKFVGQLSCSELSLAQLSGFPEEGLISIFLDVFDDEPSVAKVYHFSLKRDLVRKAPPGENLEHSALRANFSTIPSLPRPGSLEYEKLALTEDESDSYYQLLVELEESLEPAELRCSGNPPFSDEDGCYPDSGVPSDWEFFLAVRDVEALGISWPETGCAMLWVPKSDGRFTDGQAELTWQTIEVDWDDEEDEDEDDTSDDEDDEETEE